MKRILLIIISSGLLLVLAVWAFTSGPLVTKLTDSRLKITTSFYPLYFFTKEIADDRADVYNITPAGAEPHDYELTSEDRARIEDSSLLVLNGAMLEPWGSNIKNILAGSTTKVVTVGDILATDTLNENGAIGRDPHVWLDPVLAKKEVATIADALIQTDPRNTASYQANLQVLNGKLDALDAQYRSALQTCQQKNIVTSHAAFNYLAKEYGLNQVSITGLSPDAEPSAETLAQIADFARKNNVKYIFFESLVSPKLAETVAREVGAQTMVLNPIEGLTDTDIAAGKNYFTEMEANLNNLKLSLQCQ